ncbi:MAG TPA: YceI family protein [Saprospiraceae bacterium]|nr:YceI family protein [Saprospiraceae bacterium]
MKKLTFLFIALIGISFFVQSCKDKSTADKAEVGEATEVAAVSGEKFTVDGRNSIINWEASKVTGKHNGTINIASGEFYLADGGITSGSFLIAMNSIIVNDLEPGKGKEDLEAHLRGTASDKADDFFNSNEFPTAKYEITKTTTLDNDPDATHLVYGNLTLKGVTKEVGFKAKVAVEGDMIKVTAPLFMINRTDFGIKYGSAKFFDNLADKAINDEFGIAINLSANKG